MNINAHSLSEHTWAGAQKPLELHLVHKSSVSDEILIVAIPFEGNIQVPVLLQSNVSSASRLQRKAQGAGMQVPVPAPAPSGPKFHPYVEPAADEQYYNPTLQIFLRMEPPRPNTKVTVPVVPAALFNFNDIMQAASFYEYAGSLTAPPCAEIVTWLVRKDAIKASDRQIAYLNDAIYKSTANYGNYRALMPLGGRVVSLRESIPDPSGGVPTVPYDPHTEHTEREMRTMAWAVDAMKTAKDSTDYIKDLDSRLRNAAQANAAMLAPHLEVPGQPEKMPTTTTVPNVRYVMGPIKMEDTAKTMTRTLAQPGYQAITHEAKAAAIYAAREDTVKIPIFPGMLPGMLRSAQLDQSNLGNTQPLR
jgi:hypothetical protein